MREIRTSGSVGAWGGKLPGLPDPLCSSKGRSFCARSHGKAWMVGVLSCSSAMVAPKDERMRPYRWVLGQRGSKQGPRVRRLPSHPNLWESGYRNRRMFRYRCPAESPEAVATEA